MSGPKLDVAHIAQLLQTYASLSGEQLSKTHAYLDLLLKWNARMNLTAVRDPSQIVTRHFGESFFAVSKLMEPGWSGRVIDVGSGAGFPGIPIAMWSSQAEVMLIESNTKKAAFLNEVGRMLQLKNLRVVSQRAEDFAEDAELVTMRAVERFETSLPVASRLVQSQGRLALMVGKDQVERAREIAKDFKWNDPMLVPGGHSRVLLVGTKLATVGERDDNAIAFAKTKTA
jgi:16S rRNA (guanine527-N7)-methyltransferase